MFRGKSKFGGTLAGLLILQVMIAGKPGNFVAEAATTTKVVCTSLSLSTQSGTAPLGVTATLSASAYKGSGIKSYRFSFGDGSPVINTASLSVFHNFATPGSFLVTG